MERIAASLQRNRLGFGERNEIQETSSLMRDGLSDRGHHPLNSERSAASQKGEIQLSEKQLYKKICDQRLKEFETEKTIFEGKPAKRFLKSKDQEAWINKRRTYVNVAEVSNRRHIEFAKNLFVSWDDDGSGLLEPHEIIKPLIGMGLSSDHNFAKKIIQALDPSQKGKVGAALEDMKISMQDFIKIFKSDKVSENMVKIIN